MSLTQKYLPLWRRGQSECVPMWSSVRQSVSAWKVVTFGSLVSSEIRLVCCLNSLQIIFLKVKGILGQNDFESNHQNINFLFIQLFTGGLWQITRLGIWFFCCKSWGLVELGGCSTIHVGCIFSIKILFLKSDIFVDHYIIKIKRNRCCSVKTFFLQLRYLQTLNSISAEKNSTIIFPFPIELLSHFVQPKPPIEKSASPIPGKCTDLVLQ